MKKYIIITLSLFLSSINFLTSQVLGIDTLIVFNKKYELKRTNVTLTGSGNSFLSTTPCNYYIPGTKNYSYLTQADTACKSMTSYDADGKSYTEHFCTGKREKEQYLSWFIDSITIDFNKLSYNELRLKCKGKIYYFDIIEYTLQYDTCKITIALDQNAKSNYEVIHRTFKTYGKPRIIILNQMLYVEPKTKIAYLVPIQFAFIDK